MKNLYRIGIFATFALLMVFGFLYGMLKKQQTKAPNRILQDNVSFSNQNSNYSVSSVLAGSDEVEAQLEKHSDYSANNSEILLILQDNKLFLRFGDDPDLLFETGIQKEQLSDELIKQINENTLKLTTEEIFSLLESLSS